MLQYTTSTPLRADLGQFVQEVLAKYFCAKKDQGVQGFATQITITVFFLQWHPFLQMNCVSFMLLFWSFN